MRQHKGGHLRAEIAGSGEGGPPPAVLAPAGGEFLVNSTTGGWQERPSVAALGGGGFIAVWVDRSGAQGPMVAFQLFDSDGSKSGPERVVAAIDLSGSDEFAPAVEAFEGGGFALAFARTDGVGSETIVQRYDAGGDFLGETIVSQGAHPIHLAIADDGSFLAVYETVGNGADIVARLFNADGSAASPVIVIDESPGDDYNPRAEQIADGTFVVAWETLASGEAYRQVWAQLISESGALQGDSFLVSATDEPIGSRASIAALESGGFAIAYAQRDPWDVYVRIYDVDGNSLHGPILVNSFVDGQQSDPHIAALDGGGFAVTWTSFTPSGSDGSGWGVFAQQFDAEGNKVGGEILVNESTAGNQNTQDFDTIDQLENGELILVWRDARENLDNQLSAGDIYGRLFQLDEAPGGDTTGTTGDDDLVGTPGDDDFMMQQGGDDQVDAGAGDDGIYYGPALDVNDGAEGGTGTDTVAVQGDYPNLVLGDITGVEVLLAVSGSDPQFGDIAGNSYSYDITTNDGNVAPGAILTVQATGLLPGENLTFDGAAESDGHFRIFAGQGDDDLTGGMGNDGFLFGADGNFTPADRVDGGPGTDSLAFRGNYVGPTAIVFADAIFTGIEVVVLLSGHTNEYGGIIDVNGFDYDLTMADGNVAAGMMVDVHALNLRPNESLTFDGSAESDGSFRILSGAGDDDLTGSAGDDIVFGGLGADMMDGGPGANVYLYRSTDESTAASQDSLVLGANDLIDLSFIDADGGSAGNQAFAFVGANAFSGTAGELRAADQGGGNWRIEGDTDGDGVADLVIMATPAEPITSVEFVL